MDEPKKVPRDRANNDRKIVFRVNEVEEGLIIENAKLYAEGNISRWIRAAALNYKP